MSYYYICGGEGCAGSGEAAEEMAEACSPGSHVRATVYMYTVETGLLVVSGRIIGESSKCGGNGSVIGLLLA